MAEWRERGYVPDSDEEDEDILPEPISKLTSSNHTAASGLDDRFLASNTICPTNSNNTELGSLGEHNPSTKALKVNGLSIGGDQTSESCDKQFNIRKDEDQSIFTTTVGKLEAELQHGLNTVRQVLRAQTPSPAHSASNSLSSSLSSVPPSAAVSPNGDRNRRMNNGDNAEPDSTVGKNYDHIPAEIHHPVRQLRHRTQLQMNPYSLENAQFQQALKQRGLAPIRVPKAFDDRYLAQPNDESQGTDAAWSSQFVLSPQRTDANGAAAVNVEDESQSPLRGDRTLHHGFDLASDDDLPELSQILHGPGLPPTGVTSKAKRSKKNVANKKDAGIPASGQQYHKYHLPKDNHGRRASIGMDSTVFDLPPSPPRSMEVSSPNLVAWQRSEEDNHGNHTPALLATPVLSSDKQAQKRSLIEVSSSSEEFSDMDESDGTSSLLDSVSNGDESPKLVHMQKRLKGVLPASWLQLDLQQQRSRNDRKLSALSPRKFQQDRGVAQRVVSSSVRFTSEGGRGTNTDVFAGLGTSSPESSDAEQEYDQIANSSIDADDFPDFVVEGNTSVIGPGLEQHSLQLAQARGKKQRRLNQIRKSSAFNTSSKTDDSNIRSRSKQGRLTNKTVRKTDRYKKSKRTHEARQLTILDAPSFIAASQQHQPQFLKVAARRRSGMLYPMTQDPSQKFFQLATRDDTEDINKELSIWRQGNMRERQKKRPSLKAATKARLSPLTAQPHFGSGRHGDSENDFQKDIDVLKRTTAATLRNLHSTDATNASYPSALELRPSNPPNYSLHGLSAFLTRQNRAGRGKLLATATRRVAQLEADQPRPPNQHLAIRRLVPRLLKSGFGSSSTAMSTSPSGPPRPPTPLPSRLQQRRRKYDPSRTLVSEKLSFRPRASKETTDKNVDPLLDLVSKMAPIMKHLSRRTTFLSSTFIGRNLLQQAVLSIKAIEHPGRFNTDTLSDEEIYLTSPCTLQTHLLNSSTPVAAEFIARIIREMISLLSAVSINHKVLDRRLRKPDLQGPFGCLDGVIQCLSRALIYPYDNEWELYVMLIIPPLEEFVKAMKGNVTNNGDVNSLEWLRASNCMFICAYQVHAIAQTYLSGAIESRTSDLCSEFLALNLSVSLGLQGIGEVLDKVMVICDDQPGLNISGLNDSFPEIETIVIVHHILAADTREWQNVLHEILSDQINRVCNEVTARKLAYTMLVYRIIIPLMRLSVHGYFSGGSNFENWPLLSMILVEFFRHDISLVKTISEANKQLGLAATKLCHSLINDYKWSGPDSIIKIFFTIYHEHDMRNLFSSATLSDPDIRCKRGFSLEALHTYDTDFDIFIKMVAIELKRRSVTLMEVQQKIATGSVRLVHRARTFRKQLRSFVFSLLPNNSKTFFDTKDLLRIDLQAMENIYTMYEVLYLTVPRNCSPRLSQIESLTNFAQSHQSICRLILRCWSRLAAFAAVRLEYLEDLPDFAAWIERMVLSLVEKALHLRQSAVQYLDRRGSIFSARNENVIEQNCTQISQMITEIFHVWADAVRTCSTELGAGSVLFSNEFDRIINFPNESTELKHFIIPAICGLLSRYLDRPAYIDPNGAMIMHDRIQRPYRNFFADCLSSDPARPPAVLEALSNTWFNLAQAYVQKNYRTWDDYLTPPAPMSFAILADTESSRQCKVFFISRIISMDPLYFEIDRTSFYIFWIEALLQPENSLMFEHILTKQMILSDPETLALNKLSITTRIKEGNLPFSLEELKKARLDIVTHLIRYVYNLQFENSVESQDFLESGLDATQGRILLNVITSTMKKTWRNLSGPERTVFTNFCHMVLSELKIYKYEGFTIDAWFVDPQETEFPKQDYQIRESFYRPAGCAARSVDPTFLANLQTYLVKCIVQQRLTAGCEDLVRALSFTDSNLIDDEGNTVIDRKLQMYVMQHVFTQYVARSMQSEPYSLMALPIIKALNVLYSSFHLQIDYDHPDSIENWRLLSLWLLASTRDAIHNAAFFPTDQTVSWHILRAQLYALVAVVLQHWIQLTIHCAPPGQSLQHDEEVRNMALWIYKAGHSADISDYPLSYFEPAITPADVKVRETADFDLCQSVRNDWHQTQQGNGLSDRWMVRFQGASIPVTADNMTVEQAGEGFELAMEEFEEVLRAMGILE